MITGIGTALADDPLLTDRSGLPRVRPLLRVVLDSTGSWLQALLPDDPENTILKRFRKAKPDDDTAADPAEPAAPAASDGYTKNSRDGLKKLLDGKPVAR